MSTQKRIPANRKRSRRAAFARRYTLPVFLCASLIVGLLVFWVFSLFDEKGIPGDDVTEPTEQQVMATVPTEGLVRPTAPTEEEGEEPTEPTSDSDYVKQDPPSYVTYAKADADTVALGDTVKSESVILIDISENSIVASKSSDKRIFPASLTKVMTLITAYDYIDDPYLEHFTMTQEILQPLISSGNSLAGFEVGESSPLIDYMYGMIMFSGADAAEGIATHCCGSVELFVDAMNRKAKAIGLKNSHFTNPVGEHDDNHYSTVHDMALILGYAYEVDILAEVLSTYRYTATPTDIHPEGLFFEANLQQRMVGNESGTCEVLGGKTGFTNDAGHCVVTYARSYKTDKRYLFAATGGEGMYDPIWDCINTHKDYVE